MKLYLVLISSLALCTSLFAQAQEADISQQESYFKRENVVLGGVLGMQFGSDATALNISPQIGYRFSKHFTAGFGVGYNYYKENGRGVYDDYTQNYLGGNVYAQLNPIQYLRLQVQPELYGFWGKTFPKKTVVPCFLVGGGLITPIGQNAGMSFMLFYDIAKHQYSPYQGELFYSVGYYFGF